MNYKKLSYLILAISALVVGAQISYARISNPTIVGTAPAVGNQDMGGYAITNGGTITGTTVNATSTTATSTITNALQVGTTASNNMVRITPTQTYSNSISSGGAFNLTNTSNLGAGAVFTTNGGSTATGRLVQVNCANTAYTANCFSVDSVSASPAISISQTNQGSEIGYAGNFSSTNYGSSAVVIAGYEHNRGTLKLTHYGASALDSDASALSIDLRATSSPTGAQGIYIDTTTGATSGNYLTFRSAGTSMFTLKPSGRLGFWDETPDAMIDVVATSTDPYLYLSSTASGNGDIFSVLNNGNVGVGVAVPTYKMHVNGTLRADSTSLFLGNGARTISWGDTSAIGALTYTGTTPLIQALSGKDLYFGANGATSDMVIKSGGNIGIASTTPYGLLSINPNGITGPAFNIGSSTRTLFEVGNGGTIKVNSSTNGSAVVGNATLVGGTVTVTTASATANSYIMLTRKTSGGTIGTAITYTTTTGSFTISSDNILDTSVFTWFILN